MRVIRVVRPVRFEPIVTSLIVCLVSVVGSLGFEPRIANAPGWYTKPSYTTTPQYWFTTLSEAKILFP